MRAAVLTEPYKVQIQDVEQPGPAASDVLIQVLRVGVCGPDISFFQGHRPAPYPHVLGKVLAGGDSVNGLMCT